MYVTSETLLKKNHHPFWQRLRNSFHSLNKVQTLGIFKHSIARHVLWPLLQIKIHWLLSGWSLPSGRSCCSRGGMVEDLIWDVCSCLGAHISFGGCASSSTELSDSRKESHISSTQWLCKYPKGKRCQRYCMLSTVLGYMLEAIKTCLTAETLSVWLRLARWGPRDWQLSEHPPASQVEHPILRINVAWCCASEAKINSSMTPLRAGTRPCTCCAWTTPADSSGRSALHPNSYLFHIFKQVPTCFTLLNTIFKGLISLHFLKSTDDTMLHDHNLLLLEVFIFGNKIQAN